MLILKGSTKLECSEIGNFKAKVKGKELLIPQDVAEALGQLSIRTAEEFVSYIDTFPSSLAKMLQWEAEDVKTMREVLVDELKGVVDDSVLYPPAQPKRTYGAFHPDTYKKKKHSKDTPAENS